MKRFLIGLTLFLVALVFIGGSKGSTEDQAVIDDLNRTVDERLEKRMVPLTIGAELSAALKESD
jgi:hypothetical protein